MEALLGIVALILHFLLPEEFKMYAWSVGLVFVTLAIIQVKLERFDGRYQLMERSVAHLLRTRRIIKVAEVYHSMPDGEEGKDAFLSRLIVDILKGNLDVVLPCDANCDGQCDVNLGEDTTE